MTHEGYFLSLHAEFLRTHALPIENLRTSAQTLNELADDLAFHSTTAHNCGAHRAGDSLFRAAFNLRTMAHKRAHRETVQGD